MLSAITTSVITEITDLADDYRSQVYNSFFKTGQGEYGYGDNFLGVTVPYLRKITKKYYQSISLLEIQALLENDYHEIRFCALTMLVYQYQKANILDEKEVIIKFYIQNLEYLNNWDLVDVTAPKILGQHILENYPAKNIIYELSKSDDMWSQRIAIMSTFPLIKHGIFDDFLYLANLYLVSKHDLIHKAVGWMLREMGKVDYAELIKFLDLNADMMPRTMLRYSIEKLPEDKRQYYLSQKKTKSTNLDQE
jgi:3-methyladenine DNA glycosylase AlkD